MNLKQNTACSIGLGLLLGVHAMAEGKGKVAFQIDGIQVVFTNSVVANTPFYDVAGMGYGLEAGSIAREGSNSITADKPFLLSVKLGEGNYRVTTTFGDDAAASTNTVKVEMRRLMVEQVVVAKGGEISRSFVVNVRTPKISGDSNVKLKAREKESEMVNWDEKLTLEFNGTQPSVRRLEIQRVDVPTVFLTGDSTVCDQPREPWNSWGQMLPRFFGPNVAVANYAQSGESIKSSIGARRFEKVFSVMKTNDWLLVQFGHNDMKDKATNALAVYKSNLKQIVAQTQAKGATPVLVTSMERMRTPIQDTLAEYPQAVRDVAREEGVAMIDLHSLSKVLYRALGTNLARAFQDATHHNNFGSYELARCIVEGIRKETPALAKFLASDVGSFDPAHPDDPNVFNIPASSAVDDKKPDGN